MILIIKHSILISMQNFIHNFPLSKNNPIKWSTYVLSLWFILFETKILRFCCLDLQRNDIAVWSLCPERKHGSIHEKRKRQIRLVPPYTVYKKSAKASGKPPYVYTGVQMPWPCYSLVIIQNKLYLNCLYKFLCIFFIMELISECFVKVIYLLTCILVFSGGEQNMISKEFNISVVSWWNDKKV